MTTNTQHEGHTSLNLHARRMGRALLTFGCACAWATPALAQSPDLVVSAGWMSGLRASPSAIGAGGTVRIGNFIIHNRGTADASAYSVGIYLCAAKATATCNRPLASATFPGLAAGATSPYRWADVVVPSDVPAGDYYVGVLADDKNAVAESDESNNAAFAASALRVVAAVQADLVATTDWGDTPAMCGGTLGPITGVVFNWGSPLRLTHDPCASVQAAPGGALYLFPWKVENRGPEDAPAFSVGYYLSRDATITTADKLLDRAEIPGLQAGGTHVSALDPVKLTLPADWGDGTYYFGMIVDDQGQVPELAGAGEGNNILARQVVVLPGPSDTLGVWRVHLRLVTGTDESAGTGQPVYASVNDGPVVWLDRPGDDFRPHGDTTYDLPLGSVSRLGDIDRITLGKEGSNGWCVDEVMLFVNNVPLYTRRPGGCTWIREGQGLTVWYDELRADQKWQGYTPLAAALSLSGGMPHQMIEGIVAAYVGNQNHDAGTYWADPADRAIEVTRISNDSVNVAIRLRKDVDWVADPLVHVSFKLGFACSCGTVSVGTTKPEGTVDAAWYEDVLNWIIELVTPWSLMPGDALSKGLQQVSASMSVNTGQPSCLPLVVNDQGDVTIGSPAPDVVLGLSMPTAQARPGAEIVVNSSATNMGTGPSAPIKSELFLAPGPPPLGTTPEALIPSATRLTELTERPSAAACPTKPTTWSDRVRLPATLSCRFRAPLAAPFPPTMETGPHYLIIARGSASGDVNAANNTTANRLDVGLPDLALSPIQASAGSDANGRTVSIGPGYVQNVGLFASGRVRVTVSLIPRPGHGAERTLSSITGGSLARGEKLQWAHRTTRLPAAVPRGQYTLKVAVEDLDGTAECGLENNARRVPLTIGP